MSDKTSQYRILCWVSCLACIVAFTICFLLSRRLDRYEGVALVEESQGVGVEQLAGQRDQDYEFVVHNYGFEYEGKTGEYIDDHILLYGGWEKELAFFMRDYLIRVGAEEPVFLDVGCNSGYHSLFLSRHVKTVHAFDPYPPAIERFKKMIDRNEITNIVAHQVGLGDKEAELPFYQPDGENFGGGTFRESGGAGKTETTFHVVRGDDLLESHNLTTVELVKVDVEGFEEHVLAGLQKTVEVSRPVVVIELTTPPGGTIESMDQLRSTLPEKYSFFVLMGDSSSPIDGNYKLDLFDTHAEDYFSGGLKQAMVIAAPNEKLDRVPAQTPAPAPAAG